MNPRAGACPSAEATIRTPIAFLGSPPAAVPALDRLVQEGWPIVCVVSQPDRRRGRRGPATPTAVKARALDLGLNVTDRLDDLTGTDAALGVVVAFGRILEPELLDRIPMVNLHFSLLPRWRGAAPVARAIMAGDTETGVDVMAVEEGLDTGGIYARRKTPIGPDETAAELTDRLSQLGAELLAETLGAGLGPAEPQLGEPTYAEKVTSADLEIDWSRPARDIHNLVRVGGAWTTWRGQRIKIWRSTLSGRAPGVPTAAGLLGLLIVQPAGKPRMPVEEWARGSGWVPGQPLVERDG